MRLALEQLVASGAKMAGSFMSMVNLRRYSTYHYGDAGSYAGEMVRYYAEPIPEELGRQEYSADDGQPERSDSAARPVRANG